MTQRIPRQANVPAPDAFTQIGHIAYQPVGSQNSFVVDTSGVLHADHGCPNEPDVIETTPTFGQWLGLEQDLCFCVPVPEEIHLCRTLLRAHYQFPVLPKADNVTSDTVNSWASRIMHAHRTLLALEDLPSESDFRGGLLVESAGKEVAADVQRRAAASLEEIATLITSEPVVQALTKMTRDRDFVTAAFDEYIFHGDDTATLDGDLADLATAAFTVASSSGRIAVRAPKGLVQFIALYRNKGGFVEADSKIDTDPKTLETALVLWEPNTSSPYSRWPAAIRAAAQLN